MFSSIGVQELLIILVVVLVLFGNKELAQIAQKLGKGWRELQDLSHKTQREIQEIIDEEKDKFVG